MSLKKVILSTVAAAVVTTGAYATATVEASKIGNDLKFPIYYAIESSKWSTNFRVVNTDVDSSIVAKVVIREHVNSVEKLDFLIYLSPTDVFDAKIIEKGGKYFVETYDDSTALDPSQSSRITATEDGEGMLIELAGDTDGQDSYYGYIEVYGLMQNDGAKVPCNQAALDTNATTNTATDCVVDLSKRGVDHDLFEAAANLSDKAADLDNTQIDNNSHWHDVVTGLTGEAVINTENDNGALAMAYGATAIVDDLANLNAVRGDTVLAAQQIGKDTNFLAFADGNTTVYDLENALAKSGSYVIHYGKEVKSNTKANNEGAMAETRLIANFITKKYSAESINYVKAPIYTTYGINNAGGNLFNVNYEGSGTASTNAVISRYVVESHTAYDHFETVGATTPNDPLSGGNPVAGDAPTEKSNEVVVISVDPDSEFSDGYVRYAFTGATGRDNSTSVNNMPYIAMVMSAFTTESGKNVTNIKYAPYDKASTVDRTADPVTVYTKQATAVTNSDNYTQADYESEENNNTK